MNRFWKIIHENRGLIASIKNETLLQRQTIKKATQSNAKLHFWNKMKIYEALIAMKIISTEITMNDLFSDEPKELLEKLPDEVWVDKKETSTSLQEVT